MKLHELQPTVKRPKRKRVGRGMGSGSGKTSDRGHRGQGQRSGPHKKAGFEGGQMPLYRRIPKKKHFFNPNTRDWAIINVGRLNTFFEKGARIDMATLVARGLVDKGKDGLRVLGNGDLHLEKLEIVANYVTPAARSKIEAQGGTVELV